LVHSSKSSVIKGQKIQDMYGDKGTYVGLRLHTNSRTAVMKYIADSRINFVPTDLERRLHCTLIYSRRLLKKFQPMGGCFYRARSAGFDIFPNSADPGKNCLVMLIDCKAILERNKLIKSAHGATEDFPYIPHVTLTYDADGIDVDLLKPFNDDIIFYEEYSETMDMSERK
jgi:hypothetical protein